MTLGIDSIFKISYIRQLSDGRYRVYSESGRNMGTYKNREAAKKRLQQIEYFKHKKSQTLDNLRNEAKLLRLSNRNDECQALLFVIANEQGKESSNADLSYSYVIRKLRSGDEDKIKIFMNVFKKSFDDALDSNLDDAQNIALMEAIKAINFKKDE